MSIAESNENEAGMNGNGFENEINVNLTILYAIWQPNESFVPNFHQKMFQNQNMKIRFNSEKTAGNVWHSINNYYWKRSMKWWNFCDRPFIIESKLWIKLIENLLPIRRFHASNFYEKSQKNIKMINLLYILMLISHWKKVSSLFFVKYHPLTRIPSFTFDSLEFSNQMIILNGKMIVAFGKTNSNVNELHFNRILLK